MKEKPRKIHRRKRSQMEHEDWSAAHPTGADGVPARLFTDEDPATTVKGLGFRDATAAQTTIKLVMQPGARYKAYWSVRAMAERARHHPAQTSGMRAALTIFEDWLQSFESQPRPTDEELQTERQQRTALASSRANAHALSRCASVEEFNALAVSDRRDATQRLRGASAGREFLLPATSMVSLLGGPGIHGYGAHLCSKASANGLAAFRCTCGFEGTHIVTVQHACDILGPSFRWPHFELRVQMNGPETRAWMTPRAPAGQPTLHELVDVPLTNSERSCVPEPRATTGSCESLHVVLLRRDLRIGDQPALARAAAAAAVSNQARLLVCYVYDPSLLRHPTCSTAHFYFIDDCLSELENELQRLGSALFLRSGHLCGILESFRRLATSSMHLWSNHTVGVSAERERDMQTAKWCAEHGVAWHNLDANGVLPHAECAAWDWQSDEFQGFWSQHVEDHCMADLEDVVGRDENGLKRLPPPPEGLSRGARLSIEAVARLGASTAHGIARQSCQRGGSTAGWELLRTFLHQRSFGYRSKLSSPVTADTACSRLSPHLAWGSLSLRQVHTALRKRGASLHASVQGASSTNGNRDRDKEWLISLEGFRMRLHWRSHNMQKFEAMPHGETTNLVRGYDGMRDESGQSDADLRRDTSLLAERFRCEGRGLASEAEATAQCSDGVDAKGGSGSEEAKKHDGSLGLESGATSGRPPVLSLGSSAPTHTELSRRFSAWAQGRTGYPLVDACMRCLDATAWLTFRMRCLCVSFACYHLWLRTCRRPQPTLLNPRSRSHRSLLESRSLRLATPRHMARTSLPRL